MSSLSSMLFFRKERTMGQAKVERRKESGDKSLALQRRTLLRTRARKRPLARQHPPIGHRKILLVRLQPGDSTLSRSDSAKTSRVDSCSGSRIRAAPPPSAAWISTPWRCKLRSNSPASPLQRIRKLLAAACRNSSMRPARTTVPPSRITADWQTRSMSLNRWLDRISERFGRCARACNTPSIAVRPSGSRPAVGSSSNKTCGSWTSAAASFSRCFIPTEYCSK